MKLHFYHVDPEYCGYLRSVDPCVPYKDMRPYVGPVLIKNYCQFYVPLTSPKPKQKYMEDWAGFLKIENGSYGGIYLNYMIPVPGKYLHAMDITFTGMDSTSVTEYKKFVSHQLLWCNSNYDYIEKSAKRIYKAYYYLKKKNILCCNFPDDTTLCLTYSM